jgi:hypothetical protein
MKTQRAIGMEFVGSLILVLAIVGSGQMAANLTTDSGLRLFKMRWQLELVWHL